MYVNKIAQHKNTEPIRNRGFTQKALEISTLINAYWVFVIKINVEILCQGLPNVESVESFSIWNW